MKKAFALLLSLALLVTIFPVSSLHVSAADTSASAFKFDAEHGKITGLTDEGKALTEIVIPTELNGVAVTSIGDYAFDSCTSLTSITIPDSITSIGLHAFSDCTSLTNITIGNGVTTIGAWAFSGCRSLTSVTIPDSMTEIGYYAFEDWAKLQYNIYDNAKYLGNETNPYVVLMKVENQEINACEIHPDTKVIYCLAFQDCKSLTSVTIPNSVESIGDLAFGGCTSLTSVTIGNSVTSIGDDAFDECGNLQYNIYDNAKYLGNETNPYVVLMKVENQEINACEIHTDTKVIYYSAFQGCKSLTSVTIPDSIISIGNGAFYYCTALASVTIPNSVTIIDSSAFSGCTSLTSVTIPNSVIKIGLGAFEGCKSLAAINVDSANTAYASHEGVLYNKEMTEMVKCPEGKAGAYTVPTGVTNVKFDDCTSLTSVTIPDSVTTIGWRAFEDCTSLTSVTIPNSVTTIGWDAFEGCKALISVTIGNSVKTIGNYAFRDCTSLTSVTIPDSVTEIGDDAFNGCASFADAYYAGTEVQWETIQIDKNNEPLLNAAIHYNCVPAERTFADEAAGVSVTGSVPNIIPEGAALKAEKVGATEDGVVYDISLEKGGAKVQPRGSVSVKVPVPEGLDGSACKVYRVEADGIYTDMRAAYDSAGFLVFSTDHFSKYLVTDKTFGDANGDGEVDNLDAAVVLQYDAGLIGEADIANFGFSDTNGDGEVDNLDAALVLQYDAGLIEGF